MDTVFHLATSDDRKDIVEKLLQLLPLESTHIASALRRKNKKGNNPLHIAASVGRVMMCRFIICILKGITILGALDAQNIQTMRKKKNIQTMRKKKELQRLGLQRLIPAERCRIEG